MQPAAANLGKLPQRTRSLQAARRLQPGAQRLQPLHQASCTQQEGSTRGGCRSTNTGRGAAQGQFSGREAGGGGSGRPWLSPAVWLLTQRLHNGRTRSSAAFRGEQEQQRHEAGAGEEARHELLPRHAPQLA